MPCYIWFDSVAQNCEKLVALVKLISLDIR